MGGDPRRHDGAVRLGVQRPRRRLRERHVRNDAAGRDARAVPRPRVRHGGIRVGRRLRGRRGDRRRDRREREPVGRVARHRRLLPRGRAPRGGRHPTARPDRDATRGGALARLNDVGHHRPMAGMFGSSGKTSNPLGVVGAVVGAIGAGFSALLWLYHFNPDSTILGSYSAQMVHGGQLADQLGTLAIVFGAIAVVLGIIGGLGGRGAGSTVLSIILGIVALSYPVLNALHLIERHVPNPIGG